MTVMLGAQRGGELDAPIERHVAGRAPETLQDDRRVAPPAGARGRRDGPRAPRGDGHAAGSAPRVEHGLAGSHPREVYEPCRARSCRLSEWRERLPDFSLARLEGLERIGGHRLGPRERFAADNSLVGGASESATDEFGTPRTPDTVRTEALRESARYRTVPTRGRVPMITEKVATELKGSVRGDVILPNDGRYDDARKVYNAMIDKRPAVVVRCTGVADIIAAVKAARAEGLAVAIRGGGHSVPGFGTADDALVIDLGRMRGIRVDPMTKTVRAEGGSTWGDFNHATHAFGLATTGGIISTTGIAGLTLGGGIGYLTRGAGLSLDNLISADVVLADGSFVTANANANQDLFWALRGGGGNFGVVTSFQYKLQPLKNIVGGPVFFEKEDAEKVMRTFDEYISRAPRELGAFFAWQIAPPLAFIPEDRHGDTLCVLVTCWTGAPSDAEDALAPLRGAAHVVAAHVGPMPYPALNGAFDGLVPPGLQHYWKAVFAKDLSDGAIEAHLANGPKVPVVNSTMHI